MSVISPTSRDLLQPDNASSSAEAQVYPRLDNPRYPSLDIWRGFACVMIVLLHAALWSSYDNAELEQAHHPMAARVIWLCRRMGIGVPMFFVISGYCIAATADSSRRKSRRISLNYFKRRIRRIFPPYWITMALIVLMCLAAACAGHADFFTLSPQVGIIPQPRSLDALQWLGNISLTETWRYHLIGGESRKLLGPSWTLCYEEQFYLVCGLLLMVAPRRFFSGISLVTLLTIPVFALFVLHPTLPIAGFFFDGQWLMFAAGALIYYQSNYYAGQRNFLIPATLLGSIGILAFIRFGPLRHSTDADMKMHIFDLMCAIAFAMLILWLRPLDKHICNAKVLAPVAFCGRMCYSLYLIHWLVTLAIGQMLFNFGVRGYLSVVMITIPVITALSIMASWLFYYFVERHFLNAPMSGARRQPALS